MSREEQAAHAELGVEVGEARLSVAMREWYPSGKCMRERDRACPRNKGLTYRGSSPQTEHSRYRLL